MLISNRAAPYLTLLTVLALSGCPGADPHGMWTHTPGATPTPTPTPTAPTTPADCLVLDAPVTENLEVDGCLWVEGLISVNADLRLLPGVTVVVTEAGGLRIGAGGALKSEGTEEAPVRFRGVSAVAGWWQGITIEGNRSALTWTEVVHAGRGAATLTALGQVSLEQVRLGSGAGAGIRVEGSGALELDQVEVHSHAGPVASASLSHTAGLIPGMDGGDNDQPWVELRPATLEQSGRVPGLEIPYRLDGKVDVNAALELDAGAQVEVAADGALWIGSQGSLRSLGSSAAPVRLVAQAGPGSWRGVFISSPNPQNLLQNTVISGAGSAVYYSPDPASLILLGSASVALDEVSLEDGAGLGVHVASEATILSATELRIAGHAEAFASVPPSHFGAFTGSLDDGHNARPRIEVRGGNLTVDRSVAALDVPYHLLGPVEVDASLTLEPGVVVEGAAGSVLRFNASSQVVAVGTADAPVVFRGSAGATSWRGVQVQSTDPTNLIEHAVFEDGGSAVYYSDRPAMLSFLGSSRGRVANSSFDLSGGACVDLSANSMAVLEANAYGDCADGSLSVPGQRMNAADLGSTYAGPVNVRGGGVDASVSVAGIDVPYVVQATVDVNNGVFTVDAGAELAFAPGVALWVGGQAGLRVNGTSASPVLLRSTANLPGGWRGVVISSSDPANLIEHAEIREGGSQSYYCGAAANLCVSGASNRITVRDTHIASSAAWGVYAPSSVITLTNVTYAGNVDDASLPDQP